MVFITDNTSNQSANIINPNAHTCDAADATGSIAVLSNTDGMVRNCQ